MQGAEPVRLIWCSCLFSRAGEVRGISPRIIMMGPRSDFSHHGAFSSDGALTHYITQPQEKSKQTIISILRYVRSHIGQLGTACKLVLEARLSDPKEHSPNRLGILDIREGNVHEYRRRTRQRSCALLWQTTRGTSAAAAATIIYETKWTNQMHIS